MLRKRGLASAALILSDLPERSTAPCHSRAVRRNRRTFTLSDQVDRLVGGQRSGPGSWFPGADDGAVQLASHQPRQPASI